MEPRSAPPDAVQDLEPEDSAPPSRARRSLAVALAIVVVLAAIGGAAVGVLWLVRNPQSAEALRDAAIVLIGIESLIVGAAVIVLVVQVARLTALLQNEVRPMLESTNETLRTVRGTTEFLSDNMVRPVVRLSGAAAALRRAIELVGLGRAR